MSTKFNKRMALFAVNAGLILSAFVANNVLAAECGQAKLIEAGSAGVKVAKSSCQEPAMLSAGSALELSAGSRMWLKFNPSSKGEAVQVICQNKSSEMVKVQVAGANDPWIKPEIKGCESSWKNNKLTCDGGFFCAVAKAKADTTMASKSNKGKLGEMTTSVKMRSIIPVPVPVAVSDEDLTTAIVNGIKPDIDLCKNLYGVSDKIDMSWKLSGGKIQDLSVSSENKDLISCVEDVVKQANADQDISIKHSF